jgi:hypothetical protein
MVGFFLDDIENTKLKKWNRSRVRVRVRCTSQKCSDAVRSEIENAN